MSLPVAPPDIASARRLGERACVVDAGGQFTAARQVDDLAAHAAVGGAREFVFDLGGVRRYETEALVELSALCRRLRSRRRSRRRSPISCLGRCRPTATARLQNL